MEYQRLSQEEQKKGYESLWGGGAPDAFSLLGNGVKEIKDSKGNVVRTKTGSYSDTGARGDINGSHAGMVAIRRMKKDYFPEAKVITNSFNAATDNWKEERHAQVAAAEFAAFGIPKKDIIVQEQSINTVTELLHNIRLAVENEWKHIVIVTNGAQVGRTRALLPHIDNQKADYLRRVVSPPEVRTWLVPFLEKMKHGEVKVSIVAAEDILERMSPRHAVFVHAVRETELFQTSKARQDFCIPAIEAGTYGTKPPPTTLTN